MPTEFPSKLIYLGTVDDSVARHPWDGGKAPDFVEVLLRSVLTSDPIGINDGYLYQSEWALEDIKSAIEERSLLAKLARAGFLKVLCRESHFADMPRRMENIVERHTRLRERPDFDAILLGARVFGEIVKDSDATVPWPDVDIGFGFYRLVIAARDLLQNIGDVNALDLQGVPRAIVLSVLNGIIRAFEDNPIGIRGNLEDRIIPSVLREYRTKDQLSAQITHLLMGLANEFYHYSFTSLLAGQKTAPRGFDEIAVETRSSARFRRLLQSGTLPTNFGSEHLRGVTKLKIPCSAKTINFDSIMDFVRAGSGAYDSKKHFLQAEREFFAGNQLADGELSRSVVELNNAIYTLLFFDRDTAIAEHVDRPPRFVQTYWQPASAAGQTLLDYLNIQIYDGPGVEEMIDYSLGYARAQAYPVIRQIGKMTSASVEVSKATPQERISALNLVSLRRDTCQAFRAEIQHTINRFGTRSAALDQDIKC